jgi:uncharacterized coiled-coil protein SlyX
MSENELRARVEELEKKVEILEQALDEIDNAMLNIVTKLKKEILANSR